MNISLTPELDAIIREKVESGMYNSASEVVREALRMFQAREELRQEKLEVLKMEIRKGLVSLDAGNGVEMTDNLFERIKKRGSERLAELKKHDRK